MCSRTPEPGSLRVQAPPTPGEVSISAAVVGLGSPADVPHLVDELLGAAGSSRGDLDVALELAAAWGPRLPRPGAGETRVLWEALATLGAYDLQVARAVEPHLDALGVLHEAGSTGCPEGSTWGVFAAEGPGPRLRAARGSTPDGPDTWLLEGEKPWCSLADRLSHALVTAWVGDERRLFAVDLRQSGVDAGPGDWFARGLPDVRSTAITFLRVPATAVGDAGWYLERDGFAWGGLGVAAVWYGGAMGVARTLHAQAQVRTPDQIGELHLGAVDLALHASRVALADAAAAVDGGRARGEDGALLALRVRGIVASAAAEVLRRVDHALGPAPLVDDADHAARSADLHLYLRQHHAERDVATLGGRVVRRSW